MKIETFLLERNQSLFENSVRYNLTESGIHPYALKDVLTREEQEELLGLSLGYGQTNGDPALRRAVAGLYPGFDEDNVLITNGSAEANFAAIWSLIEPGDEVAVMLPNYMLAWGALHAFGARVTPFHLHEELGWAPDMDELRGAVSPRTKMIVVCNPNNPTGAVLDRATMEEIAALARCSGAYILSDEIYRGSEFDGRECTSFVEVYEKAIVCSGLSKAMALPGLRIGWIAGPKEVVAAAWHRHDYTTIATTIPSQYAARKVLEPQRRAKILDHGRELLRRNLEVFSRWLKPYDNLFHFVPPRAGGMAFVRYGLDIGSSALVERLREEKSVFVVAGDWFGMDSYLRFGIGTETSTLTEGLKRVAETLGDSAMTLRMAVAYQEWPYRETFAFARETRETAPLFVVHITDGTHIGRGECGVQSLKHETPPSVAAQLAQMKRDIADIGSRTALNRLVPASSARNALDCALWDLECKRSGASVWQLTDMPFAPKLAVDLTVGLAAPEKMRANAAAAVARGYSLIKIKADAQSVLERIRLIAAAAPAAQFIVDANEAWSLAQLQDLAPALQTLNVVLIEQPLHHDADAVLANFDSPVPLCADESCTTSAGLDVLAERYDAVNIKLDKTGGLTEALVLACEARARGLGLMVGCNGATSLGNAPAYVIGTLAGWRDLDSQELLYEDRTYGMRTERGELYAFESRLWG